MIPRIADLVTLRQRVQCFRISLTDRRRVAFRQRARSEVFRTATMPPAIQLLSRRLERTKCHFGTHRREALRPVATIPNKTTARLSVRSARLVGGSQPAEKLPWATNNLARSGVYSSEGHTAGEFDSKRREGMLKSEFDVRPDTFDTDRPSHQPAPATQQKTTSARSTQVQSPHDQENDDEDYVPRPGGRSRPRAWRLLAAPCPAGIAGLPVCAGSRP